MSGYKAFPLTPDGRVAGPPIEITATDDMEALVKARQQMDGADLQVRQGDRIVGSLSHWER
jgi:hypothetical protein